MLTKETFFQVSLIGWGWRKCHMAPLVETCALGAEGLRFLARSFFRLFCLHSALASSITTIPNVACHICRGDMSFFRIVVALLCFWWWSMVAHTLVVAACICVSEKFSYEWECDCCFGNQKIESLTGLVTMVTEQGYLGVCGLCIFCHFFFCRHCDCAQCPCWHMTWQPTQRRFGFDCSKSHWGIVVTVRLPWHGGNTHILCLFCWLLFICQIGQRTPCGRCSVVQMT